MPPQTKIPINNDLMMDHVPYEIWMMRATHDGLKVRLRGRRLRGITKNAYIESFAIHARNLINFLNGKDGSDAADFTKNYVPFANGKVPEKLYGSSISRYRTSAKSVSTRHGKS